MSSETAAWVNFLEELVMAIEDGEVQVASLKGLSLEEIKAKSAEGFDKFDQALREAKDQEGPA